MLPLPACCANCAPGNPHRRAGLVELSLVQARHLQPLSGAFLPPWGLARARDGDADKRAQLDRLLAHIEAGGPVKSSDFARTDGRSAGWWGWNDEKLWLEALFANGELMVTD